MMSYMIKGLILVLFVSMAILPKVSDHSTLNSNIKSKCLQFNHKDVNCCKTCSGNYEKIDDDCKRCLSQCNPNQYPLLGRKGNRGAECRLCHPNCMGCEGPKDNIGDDGCEQCRYGSLTTNGQIICTDKPECKIGESFDENSCNCTFVIATYYVKSDKVLVKCEETCPSVCEWYDFNKTCACYMYRLQTTPYTENNKGLPLWAWILIALVCAVVVGIVLVLCLTNRRFGWRDRLCSFDVHYYMLAISRQYRRIHLNDNNQVVYITEPPHKHTSKSEEI